MDKYSFGTKPTPQEHDAVLKYIKHFRSKDILMCIIFAIIGCGLLAIGIYAITDKFPYAAGFIVAAILFLIIALGCAVSDMDRYKLIRDSKYTVMACKITDRSCTRTKYHTKYKVSVINPNNEAASHVVSGFTYKKASAGLKALIVIYSCDGTNQSKLPADVVISD